MAHDAAALFPHVHGASAVTDWLCWKGPDTLVDLVDRYVSWRLHTPAEPVYVFVLERVEDGLVMGEGTLRFDGHPGVGDLGYWLGSEFHGVGHGSDAVELLVRAGFEHCGARALTAQIKAGNVRSLAALDRHGFRREPVGDEQDALALSPADRPITWAASLSRRTWERMKREAGEA
ncbi:hypothetical protein Poly30_44650 [Planctomycetes bacterium Poly30]|uniref:N-acetyltransferase domain-containing protein n=2 Tax=Saltatorellus ferox TaxID=2528018 RepID=A0A518EXU7_9BACT|nr:hypothetical protein Poly30_44650 [Planctomycetes bacterium Poly30]